MVHLRITKEAPFDSFQRLETGRFLNRCFCTWIVEPWPEDAGVDPQVTRVLAESLSAWSVLFLGGPSCESRSNTWHRVSEVTSVASLKSNISRLCWTRDTALIRTMFDQAGFDWSQRTQFGLLFPTDTKVETLEPKIVAKAIADEAIDSISQAVGYLRPGDDGDFAELGFSHELARQQWVTELTEACTRAEIPIDSSELS